MSILLALGAFSLVRVLSQFYILPKVFHAFENKTSISSQLIHVVYLSAISMYESTVYPLVVNDDTLFEQSHMVTTEYPNHLMTFYIMQFAFHIQGALFQPKNELTSEIWVHHGVTLFLLGFSFYSGYLSHGFIVMYLHDISDIPMFVIRLLRSLDGSSTSDKSSNKLIETSQLALAPILILSWWYFRIYSFGHYIFRVNRDLFNWLSDSSFLETVSVGCLVVLWCLHVYWFSLILKKAMRFLTLRDNDGKTKVGNIEQRSQTRKPSRKKIH